MQLALVIQPKFATVITAPAKLKLCSCTFETHRGIFSRCVYIAQELKSLPKPPAECLEVTKAVLIMRGETKNTEWKAAQKMMSDPAKFLDQVGPKP